MLETKNLSTKLTGLAVSGRPVSLVSKKSGIVLIMPEPESDNLENTSRHRDLHC